MRKGALLIGSITTGAGLFWSLQPESKVPGARILPESVVTWLEDYGAFRNFPAYLLVTLLWLFAARRRRHQTTSLIALAVFAAVTEILQLWMPRRFPSVQDVLWSWAGVGAAWMMHRCVRMWRTRPRACPSPAHTEHKMREAPSQR